MPLPQIDQSAEDADDAFEQSSETPIRLQDLRKYPGTALSSVLLFGLLGYVAFRSAQMPVTHRNAVAVLGFITFGAYLALDFADHAFCMFSENHECRDCKRETARWTPGENHRAPYERVTDRIADTLSKLTDPNPDRVDWNPSSVAARRGGDDEE
jgi:hypothetical protein